MTQFTFTIASDANPSMIRKILENIKGIMSNTISVRQLDTEVEAVADIQGNTEEQSQSITHEAYMNRLKTLIRSIDKSSIDRKDDKSNYILSK